MKSKFKVQLAAIILSSIGIVVALWFKKNSEIEHYKATYLEEKKNDVDSTASAIETRFRYFYQALRTMSLLPGVKNVDRYGKSIDDNLKKTLQQIYNNAYLNVKMSEIYLVPESIDPDKIDPITKKGEEPITTFDEFIVGGGEGKKEEEKGEKLEEVEIFEYRLMKTQLQTLVSKYPTTAAFKGIDVPAIMGRDVVTCDNSDFTRADLDAKNDYNRVGLVYTVPSYDDSGKLHGAVSGVLRTKVLVDSLPASNFELANISYGFVGAHQPSDLLKSSANFFEHGAGNPTLIASGIRKLDIKDETEWQLRYAFDDSQFWGRSDVSSSITIFYLSVTACFSFAFALIFFLWRSNQYQASLERKVEERTKSLDVRNKDMRVILDNAKEGFVAVDAEGNMLQEHSQILETWFGPYQTGIKIWEYLGKENSKWVHSFSFGFEQLILDILPSELALDQIPNSIKIHSQYFKIELQPIYGEDRKLSKILCVVTDNTADKERERLEVEGKEKLRLFQTISSDRAGFLEFVSETETLIDKLSPSTPFADLKRYIHTIKGNSAVQGIMTIADFCHQWETKLEEQGPDSIERECFEVKTLWKEKMDSLQVFLGQQKSDLISINVEEYNAAIAKIRQGASKSEMDAMLSSWRLEPVKVRLSRLADQCKRLSERLGKSVEVDIHDNFLRMDSSRYSDFWSCLVHVIRNSIDHGIETPEERESAGKSAKAKVTLTAGIENERFIIKVSDDGRGIDWDKIRTKAKKLGLPFAEQNDLVNALFSDGVSTKDEVSDISGRGVGMSAVKQVCESKHGTIAIDSTKGVCTTFTFSFPAAYLKAAA